jgi:hypothetical protein
VAQGRHPPRTFKDRVRFRGSVMSSAKVGVANGGGRGVHRVSALSHERAILVAGSHALTYRGRHVGERSHGDCNAVCGA